MGADGGEGFDEFREGGVGEEEWRADEEVEGTNVEAVCETDRVHETREGEAILEDVSSAETNCIVVCSVTDLHLGKSSCDHLPSFSKHHSCAHFLDCNLDRVLECDVDLVHFDPHQKISS